MSVPFGLLVIDTVVCLIFLSLAFVSVHNRDRPGAVSVGLLWLCLALVASILGFSRVTILSKQSAVYVVVIGWLVLVPLWAAFVFEYTGRGPSRDRRWIAFAGLYVLISGATTQLAGTIGGVVGQLLQVEASLLQTGLVGIGLFGVFLLVRAALTDDDLPQGQALLLSLGGIGVSLLVFAVSNVSPDSGRVPVLVDGFLTVVAVSFAAGVVRYQFFDDAPGVGFLARQSALEEMSEAVLVVDRKQRIVDANEAAGQTLGISLTRDAGRPAATVLGDDPDSFLNETTTVPTPTGRRQFDVSKSVLTNSQDDAVGASYLFQDVTDEQTRKQRLEVFNRVLRHNLRNDLDAIRGFAEVLADGEVEDPEDVAERIRATARDLAETGEAVERAERVMTQDALDFQDVHLGTLLDEVTTRVSEMHECQISMSVAPDTAVLRTDRTVLRTALFEVVDNAAEHSDTVVPTVSIESTRTRASVRIAVRDDGPGIPERERAVVSDGNETPLEHGSGLGLWVVSWAMTRLGGTLSFEASEDSGSIVVLEIPDRVEDASR